MTKTCYMKTLCCWATVLGMLAFCEAKAATIYVDQANTGGPWDGTSSATAWTNITDGLIDLAATNAIVTGGHTVEIASGTYAGMHALTAAHAATNEAAGNVLLGVGEVIIDAAGASYGFLLDDATYFTLRNLRITGATDGIQLKEAPSDEHYTIQDCALYENGCAVRGTSHNVDDLLLTNTAVYFNSKAISLRATYKRCVIANCTLINNDSTAVFCEYNGTDVTMQNCVLAGNDGYGADENGYGGVVVQAINCLFYKNGGGHFNESSAGVWNTASELNALSGWSGNVVATPGFVDLSSGNLRLVYDDSPCIGNGTGGSNIGLNNLTTTPSSPGYTYYVSTTGSDANTAAQATNALTPWLTIQHAADNMLAGDTVHVAAGTYAETVTITNTGSVGKPVRFEAAEGVIVDGGSYGLDLQFAVDVSVDGFKVTSCDTKGIGLNASFGCTIMNCIVDAGAVDGIYLGNNGGANLITDCETTGNTYGIDVSDSGQVIANCDAHDNDYGVYAKSRLSKLQNCNIYNNNTHGLYHHTGGVLEYDNCNIVSNAGYGLWLRYNTAHAILRNCNIIGAATYGIYEGTSSDQDAELYNCNIYDCPDGLLYDGETATVYTDVADINALLTPVDWYTNNISADPRFEDAAAGDFRLADGSPCIDAGTLTTELTSDYYGSPRLIGSAVDIGVYEAPPPPPAGTLISIR